MNPFDDFKCRCSGIRKIMANAQGCAPLTSNQEARIAELEEKSADKGITMKQAEELAGLYAKREASKEVTLGQMAIEYLMEVYAWETEGMIAVDKEALDVAQLQKGKMTENSAGILLSRHDKVIWKQHKDRISNDYLSGEIDLYIGEDVMSAEAIADIKNAFHYPGFLKKINNGLENGQREQVAGYCAITGAKKGWIANCLVDTPDEIIEDYKYRLAKKLNAVTVESPDFLEQWRVWERSMRFDHLPVNHRVHKIEIELFSPSEEQKIYDRVKHCRDFLNKFHEQRLKLNQ